MTHILEDLTHKMEGQPPKKDVIWVLGIYTYIIVYTEKIQSQHIYFSFKKINITFCKRRSFAIEPCHLLCCSASSWRSSIEFW